ncbi:restriction endonuclease subunit S [Candidatus Mycoplasma haematohominis]|uniref:Putative type-1 restriction enzyme specificity protein MPN_089 n=1 Tax=Candidatus Mycoplasma haematohominis TaxID=1494318 RepID=A0A478FTD6_9MOLU|nr:restriction endonuclease subunit S [Candidatus Mycoplasma haemohominis]GCE63749.1 putative type-1 restriction enzyme specificity protein MPN_089 [Candidatus Mycoplasma haemohominis]
MKSLEILFKNKVGKWDKEWKSLGEIATEIYSGNGVTNSQIGSGDYPCTTPGSISNAFSIWFDCCNFKINPSLIKNPKYFEHGDLLFVTSSQIARTIGDCCAYLGSAKAIAGSDILVLKHNQNPKYLSYALSTHEAKKQKTKFATGEAVIHLYSSSIKKIKIPLPPLEIQEQISEILDVLRELVRELEVELKLRKKQYRYYLNKLISDVIEKGWGEYKTLGEIAKEIYLGKEVTKLQINKGNYPCIHYGEIYTTFKIWFNRCISYTDAKLIKSPKYFEQGDLLIASASTINGKVGDCCAYLGSEKGIAGDKTIVIKHKQNPKYLAYALSTQNAQFQKEKYSSTGTITNINLPNIKKLKIPLPPLEIQEQIANALDHLRELCEDLEKGIPKEIELANKRYEYYRDLLITGEN